MAEPIKHVATLQRNYRGITQHIRGNVRDALVVSTARVLEDADNALSEPKSGKLYKRGKSGRRHQASAPGEAPATDYGFLKNSLSIRFDFHSASVVAGDAKVPAAEVDGIEHAAPIEYALILEMGTKDGRLAPRPFLVSAFEREVPKFLDAMRRITGEEP